MVHAGICAFNTCYGMRCLETHALTAACIKEEDNEAGDETFSNMSLIDACYLGDLHQVKYRLSQDSANINKRWEDDMTLAMIAAEKGHREILELLAKKGSDLSLTDYYHNNIFHMACSAGRMDIVKYILSLNVTLSQGTANISTRGEDRRTPVMIAADKGHRGIVELLVKKGSDLSLIDDYDNNILHVACKKGNVEIVEYILSLNVTDIENRGERMSTALMLAAKCGKMEVFSFLLDRGADMSKVDNTGKNILHLSCEGGNVGLVQTVLDRKVVDINSGTAKGITPLMLAAYFGKFDIFQLLQNKGADTSVLDSRNRTALHWACRVGEHLDIVNHLLDQNTVDINSEDTAGMTPLLYSAQFGITNVLKLLVENGADMSAVDNKNQNILHWACLGQCVDIANFILTNASVDINRRSTLGNTPLLIAMEQGDKDMVQVLLDEGASMTQTHNVSELFEAAIEGDDIDIVKIVLKVTAVDVNGFYGGQTPLMYAANDGNMQMFNFFMRKGADMTKTDIENENILHYSCVGENVKIVKFIIAQDILDINMKTKNNMTAVSLAAYNGNTEVFEYLVKKGADLSVVNNDGDNILHLACQGDSVNIVKSVLALNITDINSKGNNEMTPVLFAAKQDTNHVLDVLREEGADLSSVNADGDNVLHLACEEGSEDIVRYILSQDIVDRTSKNNRGLNAIMIAEQHDDYSIKQLLSLI